MSLRAALTLLLAAVALTLAACGGSDEPAPATTPPPATTEPPVTTAPTTTEPTTGATETEPQVETTVVSLYFMRGDKLGVAHRAIPEVAGIGRATLEELMRGPSEADSAAGLLSAIPLDVTVLDLDIADGIATVDLSGAFDDGGGSLSMFARLAQVVHTLTQFPTVQAVDFRLDGVPVTTFSGEGIILDHSQTREDFEDIAPIILVESVAPGDTVTSPIRLTGTSNTFEATLNYELRDLAGQVLAEGFGTATCGTGCRGTFDITIPFEASPGSSGVLEVFEISAKDGSRIFPVEIPITFG